MTKRRISATCVVVCLLGSASLRAQSGAASDANSGASASVVPRLIKFGGAINPQMAQIAQIKGNETGKNQLSTVVGVTFSLYELQEGGNPLWSESHKVQVDEQGRYTVLLGATQPDGLPLDLFTSGKALWLGVQPQLPGAGEQPRVLLVAVPYALKASDSDTLGGKPASAYALAEPALSAANVPALSVANGAPTLVAPAAGSSSSSSYAATQSNPTTGGAQTAPRPAAACSALTSDGTATATSIPMFTTNCNLEASAITQISGNIGISGASPANTKFQITDTPAPDSGIHYTNHELLNSSVTKNGTNKGITFDMDVSNMTVPTGVTDSGYRLAVLGAAYANTAGFAGTLGAQYGVWGRAGINNATSGATVSNAYAGYFDLFNSVAGTTITNAYGVYIANTGTTGTITNRYDLYASSANGKSYFAGNVGIGTTTPAAKLEVNGTAKFDSTVTFAAGQTFPGTGTVTSVATAGGLTGGPITTTGTLSIAAAGVTDAMLANPYSGVGTCPVGKVVISLARNLAPTCASVGTGTVTSITAGTGLSGGTITTSGTITNTGILNLLAPSGSGITTTGGQSPTLGIDSTVVPELSVSNTFTAPQTIAGTLSITRDNFLLTGGGSIQVSGAGNNTALAGYNASAEPGFPTLYLSNGDENAGTDLVLDAEGTGFGGSCTVDVSGNLTCNGTVKGAVKTSDNQQVGVYAVQSAENWIDDYGSGALVNGVATIDLEPQFARTVTTDAGYHVFLTPNGDCEGLYVTRKGVSSFEVHELKGGKSNVQFDYRIVAHRKGFEAARLPDLTAQFQRKVHPPAKVKAAGASQH